MPHIAVNYHYVGMPNLPFSGIHGCTVDGFRESLETLGRQFEFVSLEEILAAVRGQRSLPDASCHITFDDGLLCQFNEALPVLDDLGIAGTFFVMTAPYTEMRAGTVHKLHFTRASLGDHVVADRSAALAEQLGFPSIDDVCVETARSTYRYDDAEAATLKYYLNFVVPSGFTNELTTRLLLELSMREEGFIEHYYMNVGMLRVLGSRGMLGSHTVRHIPLAHLPTADISAELRDSRAFLESVMGRAITALSYPFGGANAVERTVAGIAAAEGYEVAWTMERAYNATEAAPLLFARIADNDILSATSLTPRARYLRETRR